MRSLLCPTVIGRDREIGDLFDAIRDATAGRGSATFLLGEAGIGKSRLVREAIASAGGLGLPVLTGRATQSSGTVAFRPLSQALLSYFRDRDLPEPAELSPFRNALARLLPQWRQGDFAAINESVVVLAEAIVRLLRTVGRGRGCLLVLEDLHWADPETLTIVEYLCENLASEPVLLVCTARSEQSGPLGLVDVLAARRAVSVARLQRLTLADTGEMARSCLATTELPESVAACTEVRAPGAAAQSVVRGFVHLAEAVEAGRSGRHEAAWASFVAGDEVLKDVTWYRSLGRRLVAEAAIADGWGEPAAWLGPALAQFEEPGQRKLVAACRSLLAKAGAPVPRRRAGSGVPLVLREHGATEREAEVLALLGEGLSNNEIAGRLFLSPRTVERHIANLTAKTDLRTRTELVAFAARTAAR